MGIHDLYGQQFMLRTCSRAHSLYMYTVCTVYKKIKCANFFLFFFFVQQNEKKVLHKQVYWECRRANEMVHCESLTNYSELQKWFIDSSPLSKSTHILGVKIWVKFGWVIVMSVHYLVTCQGPWCWGSGWGSSSMSLDGTQVS